MLTYLVLGGIAHPARGLLRVDIQHVLAVVLHPDFEHRHAVHRDHLHLVVARRVLSVPSMKLHHGVLTPGWQGDEDFLVTRLHCLHLHLVDVGLIFSISWVFGDSQD